jgi:hypothetical protein
MKINITTDHDSKGEEGTSAHLQQLANFKNKKQKLASRENIARAREKTKT